MAGASGIVSRSECNWLENGKRENQWQFPQEKSWKDLHVQCNAQLTQFSDCQKRRNYVLANTIINQHLPHRLGGQIVLLCCVQVKHLLDCSWKMTKTKFELIFLCSMFSVEVYSLHVTNFGHRQWLAKPKHIYFAWSTHRFVFLAAKPFCTLFTLFFLLKTRRNSIWKQFKIGKIINEKNFVNWNDLSQKYKKFILTYRMWRFQLERLRHLSIGSPHYAHFSSLFSSPRRM